MRKLRGALLALVGVVTLLLGVADPAGAATYWHASYNIGSGPCSIHVETTDTDNNGWRMVYAHSIEYGGCDEIGTTSVSDLFGNWCVDTDRSTAQSVESSCVGAIIMTYYRIRYWGNQCVEWAVGPYNSNGGPPQFLGFTCPDGSTGGNSS